VARSLIISPNEKVKAYQTNSRQRSRLQNGKPEPLSQSPLRRNESSRMGLGHWSSATEYRTNDRAVKEQGR